MRSGYSSRSRAILLMCGHSIVKDNARHSVRACEGHRPCTSTGCNGWFPSRLPSNRNLICTHAHADHTPVEPQDTSCLLRFSATISWNAVLHALPTYVHASFFLCPASLLLLLLLRSYFKEDIHMKDNDLGTMTELQLRQRGSFPSWGGGLPVAVGLVLIYRLKNKHQQTRLLLFDYQQR